MSSNSVIIVGFKVLNSWQVDREVNLYIEMGCCVNWSVTIFALCCLMQKVVLLKLFFLICMATH